MRTALLVLVTATLLSAAGCTFENKLSLRNMTSFDLTPYPVVIDPPPPHRAAALPVIAQKGGNAPIDPKGFNPLYYAPDVTDPNRPNALYLGLDLVEADPFVILYRLMRYPAAPDAIGADPALQPVVLEEAVLDVPDANLWVVLDEGDSAEWTVRVEAK